MAALMAMQLMQRAKSELATLRLVTQLIYD